MRTKIQLEIFKNVYNNITWKEKVIAEKGTYEDDMINIISTAYNFYLQWREYYLRDHVDVIMANFLYNCNLIWAKYKKQIELYDKLVFSNNFLDSTIDITQNTNIYGDGISDGSTLNEDQFKDGKITTKTTLSQPQIDLIAQINNYNKFINDYQNVKSIFLEETLKYLITNSESGYK